MEKPDNGKGLYRGKRKGNGEWVQGFYIHHRNVAYYIIPAEQGGYEAADDTFYVPEWFHVTPGSVGRSVGVDDMNGTPLFEGDVVWDISEEDYAIVRYIEGEFKFDYDGHTGSEAFADAAQFVEVVGNVIDNPELVPPEQR